MQESIATSIRRTYDEMAWNGEEESFGGDFLGLLLEAHHDANDKQRISVEEMVDECKTFYMVGQETTNGLLAWTVFLLALHTDWQVELRHEVVNMFGQQNPTQAGIARLKIVSHKPKIYALEVLFFCHFSFII